MEHSILLGYTIPKKTLIELAKKEEKDFDTFINDKKSFLFFIECGETNLIPWFEDDWLFGVDYSGKLAPAEFLLKNKAYIENIFEQTFHLDPHSFGLFFHKS